jgi:ATP-binding cassette subfamily F protein 3
VYGNPKALERALARQQQLFHEYDALGGEGYAAHVRDVLLGLGLSALDFDKPIGALSGGQKKLVGLARLLLARPSVLLLDEPDNHLDLNGKEYLRHLIDEYPARW